MEVDATEMEKYILNAYSSNITEISSTMIPKDVFETCILTLIMSMVSFFLCLFSTGNFMFPPLFINFTL